MNEYLTSDTFIDPAVSYGHGFSEGYKKAKEENAEALRQLTERIDELNVELWKLRKGDSDDF